MKADGQVEPFGFLVKREEIRVGRPFVGLPVAFLQDTASAVLLGKAQLFHRLVHVLQRRKTDPSQASIGLATAVGEPAVIATPQRG